MPDEPASKAAEATDAGAGPGAAPDAPADPATDAAAAALRRATRSTSKARRPRSLPRTGDSRDPQPLAAALDRLIAEQGWEQPTAVAALMGDWAAVVGADLAEHVTPVAFDDGELVLQADSTTWATQVRLLLPQVHRAVDTRVGAGVVRSIRVRGPQAPSWGAGPRRIPGRGPRDTYG